MEDNNKVFVLGIDGATFRILDPLMDRGLMPNLKKVINGGVRAKLQSTYPPLTPTAWTSFMTGKNPGKHSVYGWLQTIEGQYSSKPIDTSKFHGETLWKYVSAYGKKVGVVNVPMTYPPDKLNGFIITGMDSPSEDKCSYPEEIYHELIDKNGDYKIEIPWTKFVNKERADFLKELFYVTEKRYEAVIHLMDKYEWQFFMAVFIGLDRVQHFLWKHIENVINNTEYGEIEKEVERYYRYIDEIIGNIIDRLDKNTNVFMMSDHGFKPCKKAVQWNRWFIDNGFISLKTKKRNTLANLIIPILHSLGITRQKIKSLFSKVKLEKNQLFNKLDSYSRDFGSIDWKKTKVYTSSHTNGIRINLKGREPNGAVSPGKEFDDLILELKEKIKGARDPEAGQKIADEVFSADEIYHGPYVNFAPDLVIDYGQNPYESFSTVIEAEAFLTKVGDERKGVHDLDGIYVANGKSIKANVVPESINIMDIFPTILHIMNLPVPEGVDGRIINEIINVSHGEGAEVEQVKKIDSEDNIKVDKVRSREEDKIIEERLRGLGYID